MTALVGALWAVLVVGGSPWLVGRIRARMEGRVGAGVGQPWRDLRTLWRKQAITPRGTSEVLRAATVLLVATVTVVAVVCPFISGRPRRR